MDREQVSQLYRRLGPLVYRRCLKLLANPEAARDATQEVFVRALRHAKKLPADKACLPWLYRVATNYCLNVLRDSGRLDYRPLEKLPEPIERHIAERWLAARQQVTALLERVDPRTCQIAVYAFMDGMTQEEIAEVMGLSRKTVGKKLGLFVQQTRALNHEEQVS